MLLVPRRRQARTLTLCVSSNRFDLLFLRLRIVVRIIFVVRLWITDVQCVRDRSRPLRDRLLVGRSIGLAVNATKWEVGWIDDELLSSS